MYTDNKRLRELKKKLQDDIVDNDNKAYEYRKAMESHERKSKEAQEILNTLINKQ